MDWSDNACFFVYSMMETYRDVTAVGVAYDSYRNFFVRKLSFHLDLPWIIHTGHDIDICDGLFKSIARRNDERREPTAILSNNSSMLCMASTLLAAIFRVKYFA